MGLSSSITDVMKLNMQEGSGGQPPAFKQLRLTFSLTSIRVGFVAVEVGLGQRFVVELLFPC